MAVLTLWVLSSGGGPAKSEDAHSGVAQAARSAGENAPPATLQLPNIGISADPTAANETTGVGWLGRTLGAEHRGIQLRGLWLGAGNYLMSGGIDPGLSFNSSLSVNLLVDLERTSDLKGSSFSAKFLQVNTDPTNTDAGSVMGYNSLVDLEPYDRSELYEIWWHQNLFDDRFAFRIGKINASAHFQASVDPPHAPEIGTVSNLLPSLNFQRSTLCFRATTTPRSASPARGISARPCTCPTACLMGTRHGASPPVYEARNSTATTSTLPRSERTGGRDRNANLEALRSVVGDRPGD